MKLTKQQLKQIIAEELREVMVAPSNPTKRALQDPQVDEKIKNLLRMDDPELRRQGVELLPQLYPDDYSFDDGLDDYQGSEEYEKSSGKEMSVHRDVAKLSAIKDDFENLSGNIRASFSSSGRLSVVSKDRIAIKKAVKYAKEKHGFSPQMSSGSDRLASDPFITKRNMMGDAFFSAVFKMNTKYQPQAIELMRKMDSMKG